MQSLLQPLADILMKVFEPLKHMVIVCMCCIRETPQPLDSYPPLIRNDDDDDNVSISSGSSLLRDAQIVHNRTDIPTTCFHQ